MACEPVQTTLPDLLAVGTDDEPCLRAEQTEDSVPLVGTHKGRSNSFAAQAKKHRRAGRLPR